MKPPFPSATAQWHNDSYDAISPTRPELRATDKTIILTGAGGGIGRETAIAFAQAGAARLCLLGRNKMTLEETKARMPASSSTTCSIFQVDVRDEKTLETIAKVIGQWDVLVLLAGYVSSPGSLSATGGDEWWQSYEVNVKGTMNTTKAFLPTANPAHSSIVGVVTGATCLPAAMLPGLSAYIGSKLAQIRLLEFLAAEHPDVFVASLHPGMVDTAMFQKSGAKVEEMPMDNAQLPAHFLIWLTSPEAHFLRGRLVWSNWDVDELKAQAKVIEETQAMTSGIHGWPFPFTG